MGLLDAIKRKTDIQDTKKLLRFCCILAAYLFGILYHLFYGFIFLMDIWRRRTITESFPFTMAWGILMIWAIIKPIERKGVLLSTAILIVFKFIAELSVSHLREHNMQIPLSRIVGIIFWSIAYIQCFVYEHWEEEQGAQ